MKVLGWRLEVKVMLAFASCRVCPGLRSVGAKLRRRTWRWIRIRTRREMRTKRPKREKRPH